MGGEWSWILFFVVAFKQKFIQCAKKVLSETHLERHRPCFFLTHWRVYTLGRSGSTLSCAVMNHGEPTEDSTPWRKLRTEDSTQPSSRWRVPTTPGPLMVCVPTTPPIDNANAKIHQEDVPPTDEDSHDYNNPWQDQITDVIEGSAQKKAKTCHLT